MSSRWEYASHPFRLFDREFSPEVCYSPLGWRRWFPFSGRTIWRCRRVAHDWQESDNKALSRSGRTGADLKSMNTEEALGQPDFIAAQELPESCDWSCWRRSTRKCLLTA